MSAMDKCKESNDSHRICEICHIKERRMKEHLFFAGLPLSETRCKAWLKVIGKAELIFIPIEKLHRQRHVCGKHFKKKDFTKSGKSLKKTAMPSLHLAREPLAEELFKEFPMKSKDHNISLEHNYVNIGMKEPVKTNAGTLSVVQHHSPSVEYKINELGTTVQTCEGMEIQEPQMTTVQNCEAMKIQAPQMTNMATSQHKQSQKKLVSQAPLNNEAAPPKTSTIKKLLLDVNDATPRKKKLMLELRRTKCSLASLKRSAKLIENLDSPSLKEIVLSALANQKRKPQAKRWSARSKIAALAIYKRSPKAYRYMQHIIPLPSAKTLKTILKKIPMEPGLSASTIKQLKKIAESLNTRDKLCILAFDEIALKQRLIYNQATDKIEGFVDYGGEDTRSEKLANHALVFMIQGIRKQFKQPISFYFTSGTVPSEKLAVLIKDMICQINSIGFQIIGTVCDQGPTNMGAIKYLKQWHHESGDNFFKVGDSKFFIIYDVPHLFKSIRNNFLNHGCIKIDNKVGKWTYMKNIEEENKNLLHMSKISQTHVNPKYRTKMRVKYAAQALSQTVAAVLKLLSRAKDYENVSEELMETGLVVEDLNRLFDYTNGPSGPKEKIKGLRENVSEETNHSEIWRVYRNKLENTVFMNNNGIVAKNVKCIEGYICTIKSLEDIWNLVKKLKFKYLNLRQLNQDALENLFGIIRQHSPTNRNPTCSSFMGAIKTAIVSGMTAPHSRHSNCQKDNNKLLTNFHDIIFLNDNSQSDETVEPRVVESTSSQEPKLYEETEEMFPTISIAEDVWNMEIEADLTDLKSQPLVYVSGYIASVLLKNLDCSTCRKKLAVSDAVDNPMYDLIKLKEWWKDRQCLTYPSVDLCRLVESAIKVFEENIINNFHQLNICHWMVTLLYINCDSSWYCPDHIYNVRQMFKRIGLLLIRRQCQRLNFSLALKEENLANAYKKGQQLGISK